MAPVLFMRGVNVGGHKPFRPAAFAKELSAFEVLNVGDAGTFIVRRTVSQATLRAIGTEIETLSGQSSNVPLRGPEERSLTAQGWLCGYALTNRAGVNR